MQNRAFKQKQHGMALVIGLIMLLVMTLIGVQSMRSTTLGEKMTRNTLDREEAFEAAEVALLVGEQEAEDNAAAIVSALGIGGSNAGEGCDASFDGAKGICVPAERHSDYPDTLYKDNWIDIATGTDNNLSFKVWSGSNHRVVDLTTTGLKVNEAPKYIIEFMGYFPSEAGSNCANGAGSITANVWPYCTTDPYLFRITALATAGVKNNARVMLQSNYVVTNP